MKTKASIHFRRTKKTTPLKRKHASASLHPHIIINRSTAILLFFLVSLLLLNCRPPEQVQRQKERTLTPDERYIVELYMKINEIEKNLQDNPEEADKKWEELRGEIDVGRVRRILKKLEADPERWLAIYNRINELLERTK